MQRSIEVLPGSKYLTKIVPMNHPLAALCRLLKESGLEEVEFNTHSKLPADYLVNASPASWVVIRRAERLLSDRPEYNVLELVADGLNISDLGIGKETIAEKIKELERLLSRCDESIISEDLRNKIYVSACQETARLLDIAGELTSEPFKFRRERKRQFAKTLRSVGAEFGGESINPSEVEGVVKKLIERWIKADAPEEKPSS